MVTVALEGTVLWLNIIAEAIALAEAVRWVHEDVHCGVAARAKVSRLTFQTASLAGLARALNIVFVESRPADVAVAVDRVAVGASLSVALHALRVLIQEQTWQALGALASVETRLAARTVRPWVAVQALAILKKVAGLASATEGGASLGAVSAVLHETRAVDTLVSRLIEPVVFDALFTHARIGCALLALTDLAARIKTFFLGRVEVQAWRAPVAGPDARLSTVYALVQLADRI